MYAGGGGRMMESWDCREMGYAATEVNGALAVLALCADDERFPGTR